MQVNIKFMKASKRLIIVIGFLVAAALACVFYILPRVGEAQQSANRMLQDEDVRKLIKATQDELIGGNAEVSSLLINLNNPRVGDVYRGRSGKIFLIDRLNLFGVWMEPNLKGNEVTWRCSTAFAYLRISLDCNFASQ